MIYLNPKEIPIILVPLIQTGLDYVNVADFYSCVIYLQPPYRFHDKIHGGLAEGSGIKIIFNENKKGIQKMK